MAQVIIQTCDRCSKFRKIETKVNPNLGGWRVFESEELCPDCVRDFHTWVTPQPGETQ